MATKKQPTASQVKAAIAAYLEKHNGEGIKEEQDAMGITRLTSANGMILDIFPDLTCTIDGSPSPLVEKELRGYILEMAEDAPQSPRIEAKEAKEIMRPPARSASLAPQMQPPGVLTPQDIINYINPKATEAEAYLFAEFCKRKGADPMTKQVYMVIYEGQNGRQCNFISGKEYFTEKAEAHPQFDGFEAGIIVQIGEADHEVEYREGTFTRKGETLLGGWANVFRKDRKIPSKSKVPLADYDTKKNLWVKMPATMIRKVALVQALREAFPANFGGMYDRSEMDQAMEVS